MPRRARNLIVLPILTLRLRNEVDTDRCLRSHRKSVEICTYGLLSRFTRGTTPLGLHVRQNDPVDSVTSPNWCLPVASHHALPGFNRTHRLRLLERLGAAGEIRTRELLRYIGAPKDRRDL